MSISGQGSFLSEFSSIQHDIDVLEKSYKQLKLKNLDKKSMVKIIKLHEAITTLFVSCSNLVQQTEIPSGRKLKTKDQEGFERLSSQAKKLFDGIKTAEEYVEQCLVNSVRNSKTAVAALTESSTPEQVTEAITPQRPQTLKHLLDDLKNTAII